MVPVNSGFIPASFSSFIVPAFNSGCVLCTFFDCLLEPAYPCSSISDGHLLLLTDHPQASLVTCHSVLSPSNNKEMHLLGPRLERKLVAMFKAQLLTGKDKVPHMDCDSLDFICLAHPHGPVRHLLRYPFHSWHWGSEKSDTLPIVF